ncbi:Factor arrest protein 11, partial [Elasticomyces elasticus]
MDEVENPQVAAPGQEADIIAHLQETSLDDVTAPQDEVIGEAASPVVDTAEILTLETPIPLEQQGSKEKQSSSLTENAKPPLPISRIAPPTRPSLKRETSAPPPHPPPAAPNQPDEVPSEAPDSLTLADLRRIRQSFPKEQAIRPQALPTQKIYDFEYHDARSFPVELEEWFSYSEEEKGNLRSVQESYETHVGIPFTETECDDDWKDATEFEQSVIIDNHIGHLRKSRGRQRIDSLEVLTYIGLGTWGETAGLEGPGTLELSLERKDQESLQNETKCFQASSLQLEWIRRNTIAIAVRGGLPIVLEIIVTACKSTLGRDAAIQDAEVDNPPSRRDATRVELWCALTLMYLFLEVARNSGQSSEAAKLRHNIASLEPNILATFTEIIARLRWDDCAHLPLSKMLLLTWKAILVCFGGTADVEAAKESFSEDVHETDQRGQPVITASPLDYHLFRQEISSKYPAYQPPPPLFPLEPEHNSILPPLKHRQKSFDCTDSAFVGVGPATVNGHGSSIMHQPVHIATPAPSPPPSPAGPGGKGGKKQNYQTNQMFPFLYPPLDPTSNNLGGKGNTELQDALVGRRWEGRDIPTSILEAAELFAHRMRATRAMKQLWQARVDFMKYDRGWRDARQDSDVDPLELQEGAEPDIRERPDHEQRKDAEPSEIGRGITSDVKNEIKSDKEDRLDAVDRFY